MLEDSADGALSWLERRYVHGVEVPHGLPKARRQVSVRQDSGTKFLDNLYEGYQACIELDGVAAHPQDQQWRDKERDNWNLIYHTSSHCAMASRTCGPRRTAAGLRPASGNCSVTMAPQPAIPAAIPPARSGGYPASSQDPRMPTREPTDP